MNEVVVERWHRDTSTLMWDPVVRFFVGGPLDGRALEGADSREWEAGPMAATNDYYAEGWILYVRDRNHDQHGWLGYRLHGTYLLKHARRKYIVGEMTIEEFEQAVEWSLAVEEA